MYMFRDSLPRMDGNVRFMHAIPDAPSVDIYANGKLLYSKLSFGNVTKYISISPGTYTIELFKSGTYDTPLNSESTTILPNSVSTVAVTYEDKEISYFIVDDTNSELNPLLSYVRFINLAPTAPLLSLSLPEGIVLFNEASYLETNDYFPTSPGVYNFIVSSADGDFDRYISNVTLTKNMFVTIYIVGLYKKKPPLGYIILQDGLMQKRNTNL